MVTRKRGGGQICSGTHIYLGARDRVVPVGRVPTLDVLEYFTVTLQERYLRSDGFGFRSLSARVKSLVNGRNKIKQQKKGGEKKNTQKVRLYYLWLLRRGVATPFGNAQPLSLESWPTLYRMSGAALFSQYRPTSLPRSTYFFTESCTSSTDCPSAGGKKREKEWGKRDYWLRKKRGKYGKKNIEVVGWKRSMKRLTGKTAITV